MVTMAVWVTLRHSCRPHMQLCEASHPPSSESFSYLGGRCCLTSVDLRGCGKVTAAGVQALRSSTAAPSLHIEL
jgi:hypothetical protein